MFRGVPVKDRQRKILDFDERKSGEVVYWREQWAKTINEHLGDNKIPDLKAVKKVFQLPMLIEP